MSTPHDRVSSMWEKEFFSLLRSTLCHSISIPIARYEFILQNRKTLLEINCATTIDKKILYNPSISNVLYSKSTSLFVGSFYIMIRSINIRICDKIFKKMIRRYIYTSSTDNICIKIFKRILSASMNQIISLIFGHSLLYIRTLYAVGLPPYNGYKWRFGFTQPGFTMFIITCFVENTIWFTSFVILSQYFKLDYFMNYELRKYITNFIIYPLDTICRRQMITNENIYDATISIIKKHGICSLFDGAFYDIIRTVSASFVGNIFDKIKNKYIEYKYDINGIANLCNFCKFKYNKFVDRDLICVQGYIRKFIEKNEFQFEVPQHLIHLIGNTFYHQKIYDILDERMDRFAHKLGNIKYSNKKQIKQLILEENLCKNTQNLWENRRFQKLWRNAICDEIVEFNKNRDDGDVYNINNSKHFYFFGTDNIRFYCDECDGKIERRYWCRFRTCGHVLCVNCTRKLRITRKCGVCNAKYQKRKSYDYLVPRISLIHESVNNTHLRKLSQMQYG